MESEIIESVTHGPAVLHNHEGRLLTVLQVVCAIGLGLGFVTVLPGPVSGLPADTRNLAALLALGYLFCAALLFWRERRGRYVGFDTLISCVVVGFTPALAFDLRAHPSVPNHLLVAGLVWGALLATVTVTLRRWPPIRSGVLALAAVVSFALPFVAFNKPQPVAGARVWKLNSALYALRVTEYRKMIGPVRTTGSSVASFRDQFLVANPAGDIFLVSTDAHSGELTSQSLKERVPINWAEFQAAFGKEEYAGYFRTADLFAQDLGDRIRLFASHHFWKADQKCFVVRVSMLELNAEKFVHSESSGSPWKTIFESTPCLPLELTGQHTHFGGIQVGGRLALLNANELLISVGDHERDGVTDPAAYPQDSSSSYGKTILLNLTDFSSQQYSMGHRNPQGLFADGADGIWLTEHGPQGGDELNLLQRGSNYGWPLASYGTQYGAHAWPGDPVAGSHAGYAEPFYSWVPSIGVSSLLVIHGAHFKLWDHDLIVASLRDGALYRARVRDSRVVMLERIPFDRRIRDIAEGSDGRLLLTSDSGALLQVEADNDVGTGEGLYQACSGCHMIGDGTDNGIGPDLRKVVNRRVAAIVGYHYSTALKDLGGVWDRKRLDQFLTNPQAFLPGTRMAFPGISNPTDRKELIEFLASGANNHPPPENEITD